MSYKFNKYSQCQDDLFSGRRLTQWARQEMVIPSQDASLAHFERPSLRDLFFSILLPVYGLLNRLRRIPKPSPAMFPTHLYAACLSVEAGRQSKNRLRLFDIDEDSDTNEGRFSERWPNRKIRRRHRKKGAHNAPRDAEEEEGLGEEASES